MFVCVERYLIIATKIFCVQYFSTSFLHSLGCHFWLSRARDTFDSEECRARYTSPTLCLNKVVGKNGKSSFSQRSPRPPPVPSLQRQSHGHDNRDWLLWQRRGGSHCWSSVRCKEDPRLLPGPETDAARGHPEGGERVREGVPADEHPPSPARRPVSWRVFPARLADARTCHGEAGDESPRRSGPRALATDQALHPRQPQVLRPSKRGQRSRVSPQPLTAHHPPRLVRQKRSPERGDGGQDS